MFSTLRTLFRARAAEAEEAMIDANAVTLLAQHLRDARADLARGRKALASLIAQQKDASRREKGIAEEVLRREAETRAAISAGEHHLAGDLADRIAGLEDEHRQTEALQRDLSRRIASLRETLDAAETKLTKLANDLRAARAAKSARTVRRDLDDGVAPGALARAEEMSERLRSQSAILDDEITALTEIPMSQGADLDARLRESGVSDLRAERRSEILRRLSTKPSE